VSGHYVLLLKFIKGDVMQKKYYASLQHSESVIFQAAANIFASFLAAGKVTDDNENEIMKKAITISIKMADHVDSIVKSDGERA